MPRLSVLALALLAAQTGGARAQSFDHSGSIDIGLTDMARGSLFGAIDATFVLPISKAAPLAFEFGTYLFALDGKNPHETYAALTLGDSFRIGALRPAYDAVLPSVFAHVAPYLAYSRAEYSRSYNTVEAMRRTAVPWGVSAGGHAGQLDWIVSLHDATKGAFRSASFALTWRGTGYSLMAAFEALRDDNGMKDSTNAKIGARIDLGRAELGLAWLDPEANARPKAVSLDLSAPLGDRLGLSLMGEFTKDARDDAYGMAMGYDLRTHGTITLAGTDGAAGPGAHLTYTYQF